MTRFAEGRHAWSVSQRSGLRFPYTEMVKEQGTDLWVHISESDKGYNSKDHPQGKVKAPISEQYVLKTPFIEVYALAPFILSESGEILTIPLMFNQETELIY